MDQRLRCGPEGGCEDGLHGPSPQKVHVEAWVDRLTGGLPRMGFPQLRDGAGLEQGEVRLG